MNVTIPGSVVKIEKEAFSDCIGLKKVLMLDGVKYIRDYAFWFCKNLKHVTIPTSVVNIGADAFFNCPKLKEVIFKGKTKREVQSMDNYPFGIIEDESIIKCIKN